MEATSDAVSSARIRMSHFRVNNMTYAITQPIYQVDLTDPEQQYQNLGRRSRTGT